MTNPASKEKQLSRRHQLFIEYYTDPNSDSFLNGAESYRKVYKSAKNKEKSLDNADTKANKLMQREDIKSVVNGKFKDFTYTKEEYLAEIRKYKAKFKNESSIARLLELEGKVNNLLKDNEIQVNTAVFNEAQEKLRSRLA